MDINNNQQINTFTKGMDTDTSDMYMGEGSYRYAENLRVVTNEDSNSGELHIIEGTDKITLDTEINGILLGFTSIRDYIIAIVLTGYTNNTISDGDSNETCKWNIYKIKIIETRDSKVGEVSLVAGPFEEQIWPDGWDGKTKPLSLVTRWESSKNIKLYIANGETELLSIDVAEKQEGSFDDVFRTTKTNLPPIKANVTKKKGAKIPGVTLQYAYILYKVNGPASTLSMLSNVVTEELDNVKGYKVDDWTEYLINLKMPVEALNKYVRVYRVAYSKAGQLPRVDVIYDQKCATLIVVDSGQSLLTLSSAEFIATNALLFVPKEIESKGDYLFAGNVEYSQDLIDAKFENFDARCYSAGNYYNENDNKIPIGNAALDDVLASLDKNIDLHNDQFDGEHSSIDFDVENWKANADGYNGHGLCFDWKYVYDENFLYYTKQYGEDSKNNPIEPPRTYARNEVYRFGVRLFDKYGNASSVKWIADIKMPNYINPSTNDSTIRNYITDYTIGPHITSRPDGLTTNNISILFTPRNTHKSYWNDVAKYEIVQAKRSINDSYKIAQGIAGHPIDMGENECCLPYFLTKSPFTVTSGMVYKYNGGVEVLGKGKYEQNRRHLIFCCPEYTYQPDDIKELLKQNSDAYYKEISHFARFADVTSDNPKILSYRTSDGIVDHLNKDNTDLHIKCETDSDSYLHYYLDQTIMVNYNHNRQLVHYHPIGGTHGYTAHKNVFFTNMYAQKLISSTLNESSIKSIFVDAQEDNFAKDEWPTYRSQFKTLPNGDKFYNWTNPALMRKWIYEEYFAKGGNTTDDSFLDTTMTSLENEMISWKYETSNPEVLRTRSYDEERGIVGSSALTFPTSTGGPSIVLDLGSNINRDIAGYKNSYNPYMPAITVANICRHATPYGGYNLSAINSTQYISQGYCKDPTDGPIKVSMGDNYITMFVYCLYHSMDNAQHNDVTTAATQYIVPIESTIDISKQCSDYLQIVSTDSAIQAIGDEGVGVWVQAKPSTVAGRFTQTTDMYMYNTAYSIIPDIITYAGQDTVNQVSPIYDSRIHYSQKKLNNELIDNWTSFKAIDYLDVDSRYGQITGLKLFKDKLIFLQENGAGVLSVNDRIILKDQESANIIVGNGGVLDRYDYFTTIYGMKPDQHAVEASNDALYWWDGYRKEIIAYTDGYNINLLQRIKNVANYINKGTESDTPSIIYDANNKEVLFNVVNNKCITYNEQIQQFTSVYTFNPIYYSNIDGKIYLTDQWVDREHLYEYNQYNKHDENGPKLFEEEHHPMLKYVVNKEPIYNKVFDIQTFGCRFYGGSAVQTLDDADKHLLKGEHNNNPLTDLTFTYNTPTKQQSTANGSQVTNREYDYRLTIPRNHDDIYGGRMRGKTMECTLISSSNDKDFSIQYVTTKYRMSWT